jgi:hypothetical protein
MLRWWKPDGTTVKTQWWKTTIARWWNNDDTILKQRRHDENVMVGWRKHDVTMVKIRWYHDETEIARWWNAIFFSPSWHRIIKISLWCDLCFIIVPSCNRAFNIIQSCIAVQGDKKVKLMYKQNTIIGQYLNDTISWLVTHLSGISRK